jgi:hypothetical protein
VTVVYVGPRPLRRWSPPTYFFARLGYQITYDSGTPCDLALSWGNFREYGHPDIDIDAALLHFARLSRRVPVINGRISNIDKSHVDGLHSSSFGYGAAVDPTTYAGQGVIKSDLNNAHDGRVVQFPIPPDAVGEGYVYSKELGTRDPEGLLLEYRVFVVGGRPALVLALHKSEELRFAGAVNAEEVNPGRPADFFAPDECDRIVDFCRQIGLDYGELDVMRGSDQRPYIIDCNPTPGSAEPFYAREFGCFLVGRSPAYIEQFHRLRQTFAEDYYSAFAGYVTGLVESGGGP